MNGSAGERWRKKQSDKPPQVDYYWVSPKSISPNNIQVLPWIWWPFSLGCKRPAPFHAPTREAGKQARQASCLLRLFLSPSPLHHLSPTRRPAASSTHAPLMCCLWHHQKTLSCSDLCVCVCVCVCVDCGCLLSWVRPPSINRYSSPATTEPGGPPELTKHAFFFAKLMRTRSRKGRKNAWKGGKRWRGSSKQPQRIYLTEGERRERESRETFWMGMQICAHETTLRLCYLSLPPYKLQYTTAGCCLSVTTTVLYYKLVAAAKPRLFAWNPLGLFHNSRETTSCVCPGVQLETACRWSRCLLRSEILKSP